MKTMYRKNLLRYALFAFVCVFAILLVVPFVRLRNTASAGLVYENVFVGDVIEAQNYEITHNESKVKAEGFTVVYPSGGVYGGDKFTMTQAGKYEITYYATIDGAKVEETRYYMAVRMPQNIIVGNGVALNYGKYEVESPYQMKKETYGAIATLRAGDRISFSTNIKTSKLTADYSILDMIVMPSVFKETDFEKLTVRVTDAENAENYVDIVIISSNMLDGDGQVSYVQAGANGQQLGGYEGTTFHVASFNYGTQVEHSFRALARASEFRNNHTVSEHSLTIAIDNEEKKVYCGPYSYDSDTMIMVNDLDSTANYKGNPWGGFTSDEVTVTIMADRFVKASGNLLIKSFGDFDLSADVKDTVAPQISVDCDESKGMPIAKVGKEFPIFPFTVKDALDAQVKTDVFVYYTGANNQQITVENDGKTFFAKYAGEYKIVYRAEDYSGNVSQVTKVVYAQESLPNVYVAIENPMVTATVYDIVNIPMAADVQAFGGSGYLSVERSVYAPNHEELDVEDALQLTMLGDYKVVYKVTDYLGEVEYSIKTITSTGVDKPLFVETPSFDVALIKNFVYELPQAFVIETVGDEIKELACKIYVNGTLTEDSFTATGEAVEILYVAKGSTGEETEYPVTLSVIDTEKAKLKSKYFYTEDEMSIVDEKTYIEFSFDKDGKTEFVSPLYAQGFEFSMSFDAANINFTSMTVVLTDAHSKKNTVSVQLIYSGAWYAKMKGSAVKLPYAISKDILTFALSDDTKRIIDTSGTELSKIATYDNGKPFQGFADTLYVSFIFEGVQSASSIRMTQLCNQSLGHNKKDLDKAKDEIKPVIFLDEPFMMRQKLGTKAAIPTARAYDVLGQITEFTVTVTTITGEVLASGSAMETLDLTLDKAGSYLVTYYAEDTYGNFKSLPYSILVSDETAPTLTVKDSLKKEYKVGSTIKIPTYSATDNGENCYIQVSLIMPNNELRVLQYSENGEITYVLEKGLYESAFCAGKDAFVVLDKGRYTLRVLAYDEYYNCTVKEIEFIVK